MDDETFDRINAGLKESIRRFPNCRVASCDCDEKAGEWVPGCNCPGHWEALDEVLGKGRWSLADAAASAKVGKPVRAE